MPKYARLKWSRLIGIFISVSMLVFGYNVYQQQTEDEGPALADNPVAEPERGGQLIGSLRSEVTSYNRLVRADANTEVLSHLLHARLLRINKSTFELEPWLAESFESSANGLTHTLHLRPGLTWSDGTALTADDVLFTLAAVYDERTESPVKSSMTIGGQQITATAPNPATVVLTFPAPSGPGLRLLDNLPIYPKHKLEAALAGGTLRTVWDSKAAPADVVTSGPFVVREYQVGQRLVLDRNPRYWRKAPNGDALPYLDRLVLEIVPDQNAELLRLQSGSIDLTQSELRADDYVAAQRAEDEGKLKILDVGVGTDADAFWFCLNPAAKRRDPRFAFVQRPEFRQAISHAVDRERFADQVFLSAAVPVWGPVTPGNKPWFWSEVPRYAPDLAKARQLLASIGLEDRNNNGVAEDARGTEARFTVITQRGIGYYERGTAFLKESAARVGIVFDVAPLENSALIQRLLSCDYDAIYLRPLASDIDPAGNPDFWLSSGAAHLWNMNQAAPATEWERRIDTLMLEQAATIDPAQRKRIFNDVQRIFAENLPALYFAAPRSYYAHSTRVLGVVPSVLRPPALWNADMIGVTTR